MKTVHVRPEEAQTALGALVKRALELPWSAAKELIARGKVAINGKVVTDPGHRLTPGWAVTIDPKAPTPEGLKTRGDGGVDLERARLLHHDAHLIVVDKPPGVSSVPFEPGERGTLVDRLATALHRWKLAPAKAPLFVVHRLDRETSGVMVFGRTWVAKRHLAGLFRQHALDREYVALVHGRLDAARTVDSVLLDDRGDGLRGSARGKTAPHIGQRAITHLRPIKFLEGEEEATLVAARLETGRQHQIRIHLSEMGHPLVGERVYIRNFDGPRIEAPRVMLHARTLGFTHPAQPEASPRVFEAEIPEDFRLVAKRLGLHGSVPKNEVL
ncbi:MAG: RluA family pseudouridine synthase [Myxococcales bacterium]|nr:RluA family pseudouridine synthase [Myxococcales bacterium]